MSRTILPRPTQSPSNDIISQVVEEKRSWPGWSTIESEPAVFNELLKNIGVKDAQVEEIYSLDEDSLHALKPVHGLIFLFRWKSEVDPEEAETSCPEDVWFANQVTDNLCASLAMLNIVMNCVDVDIGEHLRSFREFSHDLSPPLRGLALANFEYLRQCHNAFARRSEMMDSDIGILEASRRKKSTGEEEEEESFHFIAYVPIGNSLWELDGLKRQPVRLGRCTSESWLSLATPKIQERILRYEQDEIRFTLLAIVKKPLSILQGNLATNIKTLAILERHLDRLNPEWRATLCEEDAILEGRTDDLDSDQTLVAEVESESDIQKLVDRRATLVQEQRALNIRIRNEQEKLEAYSTYATRRQHDYSPFIRKMLGFLADKQCVQQYLES